MVTAKEKLEFGVFVYFMRSSVGWSLQDLAEKLGKTYSGLRKYEKGRTYPPRNSTFEEELRSAVKKELKERRRVEVKVCEVVPMREVFFLQWDKEEKCWNVTAGQAPYHARFFYNGQKPGVPQSPRDLRTVSNQRITDAIELEGLRQIVARLDY